MWRKFLYFREKKKNKNKFIAFDCCYYFSVAAVADSAAVFLFSLLFSPFYDSLQVFNRLIVRLFLLLLLLLLLLFVACVYIFKLYHYIYNCTCTCLLVLFHLSLYVWIKRMKKWLHEKRKKKTDWEKWNSSMQAGRRSWSLVINNTPP